MGLLSDFREASFPFSRGFFFISAELLSRFRWVFSLPPGIFLDVMTSCNYDSFMNTQKLLHDFQSVYGMKEGLRIYLTVTPGILADFSKMLDHAPAGKRISEEYLLDDGKSKLVLSGIRTGSSSPVTEAVLIRLKG